MYDVLHREEEGGVIHINFSFMHFRNRQMHTIIICHPDMSVCVFTVMHMDLQRECVLSVIKDISILYKMTAT